MRRRLSLAVCVISMACWCRAQNVQILGHYDKVKAENGLIIGWQIASEDRATRQIDIYDRMGNLLAGLAPLRLVSEAKRATVYDVSALPGRFIAVAAVYRKSEDTVPAASLLYFDFQGSPLLALALDPSREVLRLTVDADSNVWTLTEGVGERKPNPEEPMMVVAYDASGNVLKRVFRRSEFPDHVSEIQENDRIGNAGFGHTSDSVWFWLPLSTDLVAFKTDGSSINRSATHLPGKSPQESPVDVFRTDKGTLVTEVWSRQDRQHASGQFNFFLRSAVTKQWEPFYPPCVPCHLIGTDSGEALFMRQEGHLEIYAVPLP